MERDMEPNVAVLTFVLLTASSSLKPKRSCTGIFADQPVYMLAVKLPAGSALDMNGSHLAGDDALDMIVPVDHDKMPQAHGPKHCVSALNGKGFLDCDCTAIDVGPQVNGFCKDGVVTSRQPIH